MPPGVAGGGVSPATGSIRLAGEHFTAATLYLLAGSVGLVWIAPELARGNYLAPHVAGVTHLFTLGWLTMTIFGALYQLLPVALGAPIRWPMLGHVSFCTFAPGAGLFACGVADNYTMVHHVGIGLVAIGIVLTVTNVALTLPRARARDVTWAAIAIAITYLSSTLVLGVVLLHNLHTGFIAAERVAVLATHLHVAIVGWALIMMVGVAHRLLPMFLLAHGGDSRWTRRTLTVLAAGVPLLAVGLNLHLAAVSWAAVVLMECGVACFLYQAIEFYRIRVRKRIDIGMRFAAAGLGFLAAAGVLGPFVLWHGTAAPRLATAYVAVGLLGGIVVFVIGFFYKIVPLLAWVGRYRGKASVVGTPTIAQMFSARVAEAQLAIMATALTVLLAGILSGSAAVTYPGAILFLIGILLFLSQIGRVALGGRSRASQRNGAAQ
ncbi:MAG TPA: hypothetical protein VFK26_09585 [Gemmatimonadaceae bacterium]|nr:hypothetical protein [Gemmatimonadaceae bacterium]